MCDGDSDPVLGNTQCRNVDGASDITICAVDMGHQDQQYGYCARLLHEYTHARQFCEDPEKCTTNSCNVCMEDELEAYENSGAYGDNGPQDEQAWTDMCIAAGSSCSDVCSALERAQYCVNNNPFRQVGECGR